MARGQTVRVVCPHLLVLVKYVIFQSSFNTVLNMQSKLDCDSYLHIYKLVSSPFYTFTGRNPNLPLKTLKFEAELRTGSDVLPIINKLRPYCSRITLPLNSAYKFSITIDQISDNVTFYVRVVASSD